MGGAKVAASAIGNDLTLDGEILSCSIQWQPKNTWNTPGIYFQKSSRILDLINEQFSWTTDLKTLQTQLLDLGINNSNKTPEEAFNDATALFYKRWQTIHKHLLSVENERIGLKPEVKLAIDVGAKKIGLSFDELCKKIALFNLAHYCISNRDGDLSLRKFAVYLKDIDDAKWKDLKDALPVGYKNNEPIPETFATLVNTHLLGPDLSRIGEELFAHSLLVSALSREFSTYHQLYKLAPNSDFKTGAMLARGLKIERFNDLTCLPASLNEVRNLLYSEDKESALEAFSGSIANMEPLQLASERGVVYAKIRALLAMALSLQSAQASQQCVNDVLMLKKLADELENNVTGLFKLAIKLQTIINEPVKSKEVAELNKLVKPLYSQKWLGEEREYEASRTAPEKAAEFVAAFSDFDDDITNQMELKLLEITQKLHKRSFVEKKRNELEKIIQDKLKADPNQCDYVANSLFTLLKNRTYQTALLKPIGYDSYRGMLYGEVRYISPSFYRICQSLKSVSHSHPHYVDIKAARQKTRFKWTTWALNGLAILGVIAVAAAVVMTAPISVPLIIGVVAAACIISLATLLATHCISNWKDRRDDPKYEKKDKAPTIVDESTFPISGSSPTPADCMPLLHSPSQSADDQKLGEPTQPVQNPLAGTGTDIKNEESGKIAQVFMQEIDTAGLEAKPAYS